MRHLASRALVGLSLFTAAAPSLEASAREFVVVRDDGTLADKSSTPGKITQSVLKFYATTGLALPEVMSVWTSFPQLGDDYSTLFDPLGNDVDGIGIAQQKSLHAPLRAILLHNNITKLSARASLARAPVDGFGTYLFLLEFGHQWGPAVVLPTAPTGELEGFPYHWSFFLDAASPIGGNAWTDNGDGSYTVVPANPKSMKYSMLDLYLMGLAAPSEVGPITVLTPTSVPAMPTDPYFKGPFSAQSFPWFDTMNAPLTIQATPRAITIDDIVTANGARMPAAVPSVTIQTAFVLVVGKDDTDQQVADAIAAMDPVADTFAPAFHTATSERGTLDVISENTPGTGGAGGASTSASTSTSTSTSTATSTSSTGGSAPSGGGSGCSCRVATTEDSSASIGLTLGAFTLAFAFVRRARSALQAARPTHPR